MIDIPYIQLYCICISPSIYEKSFSNTSSAASDPRLDKQKSGSPIKGIRIFVSKWRDSKRNLNRRGTPLERALRSFRLIRSPSFACGDAPLGRRSARSPAAFWSRTKDFAAFSGSHRLLPRNTVKCPLLPAFPVCFPAFPALIPVEFKPDILAFPLFKGV